MPQPSRHLAVALPFAVVVPPRWRVPFLAGATLIDADHFVDLAWTRAGGNTDLVFLPLHGLDVVAAVAAFAAWRRDERFVAFALGVALHLGLDLVTERDWAKVSLLLRAARRFYVPGREREWMYRSPREWV